MQTTKIYSKAVGRTKQEPDKHLPTQEEQLAKEHRNKWRQEYTTQELENFLLRYERKLLEMAMFAASQEKETARLLNKAKTVNEIIEYVRTGKQPIE
jgi:hypothetical protein